MSVVIDKSVKATMRKLTSLALKLDNIELDISLKTKFNSVWITSEHVRCLLGCSPYMTITYLPDSDRMVNEFEQEIETQIAYLKKESKKLTKKGNE